MKPGDSKTLGNQCALRGGGPGLARLLQVLEAVQEVRAKSLVIQASKGFSTKNMQQCRVLMTCAFWPAAARTWLKSKAIPNAVSFHSWVAAVRLLARRGVRRPPAGLQGRPRLLSQFRRPAPSTQSRSGAARPGRCLNLRTAPRAAARPLPIPCCTIASLVACVTRRASSFAASLPVPWSAAGHQLHRLHWPTIRQRRKTFAWNASAPGAAHVSTRLVRCDFHGARRACRW